MSQLSDIQKEILRRFQRPQDQTRPRRVDDGALPQPVDAPTGGVALAGRTRSVFAPPAQQPADQILTPTNREAITRPRSVFAPPPARSVQGQPQPTFDGKPILAEQVGGEPFGTRDRRTQPRDVVADDTAYLRDQNAQPRNWKDKSIDALRALNQVWGSNPKAFTPTAREREIGETEERIATGTVTDLKRAQTAAAVARPDQAQQRIDLTAEQNKARRANWGAMDSDRRKKTIIAQYKAGMLNDPESLDQAARELNIPGELQPAFIRGEMRDAIDDNGNFININRRTNQITPVVRDGQPVGSFTGTQEAGRERRATTAETGRNTRQDKQIAAANTRAANARAAKRGTPGEPNAKANRLVREYNQARASEMNYNATRSSVDDDKRPLDPATKAQLQSRRENLWQEIMDTYPGTFEADDQFRLRPKAGQSQPRANKNAVTISEREIREAGGTDADIADAKRRAQRGEIALVP